MHDARVETLVCRKHTLDFMQPFYERNILDESLI